MINDSNTTTSFRVFLHPWSLQNYDLLTLLSPGDVIGCDMAHVEEIRDYKKLVEKGIRFVDFSFSGKVVTFFAGDGDWVKVTLDGIDFRVILDIKPNDTGKERSIGISLDCPYGMNEHFCANGFQIIQLAK